ncbi:helix-turn-helix domain-containing protein [Ruegeria arenilitoris]|uniref:helix-turn-helix domain-containing protein n=1 Tax=Ruegeria arenilitoris TaxID=1173585 RepID=UPI00147A65F8|nr:helix-turn-helix transcriptional regulator [Ruegeria arenilitoris]
MKKPDEFELELQSIQCTLEALDVVRDAFERRSSEDGLTKKEFSEWLGKDPSYVSRILNGRVSNVNYKTIAQMLIALGYFPEVTKTDLEELVSLPNYRHCDAVEDHYIRSRSDIWRVHSNKEDEASFARGNNYKKFLVAND